MMHGYRYHYTWCYVGFVVVLLSALHITGVVVNVMMLTISHICAMVGAYFYYVYC